MLGEHDARVDSVRAESAAGAKERAPRTLWTAFALSLLARGERGTESVYQRSPFSWDGAADV
jgi:hypothetical protein